MRRKTREREARDRGVFRMSKKQTSAPTPGPTPAAPPPTPTPSETDVPMANTKKMGRFRDLFSRENAPCFAAVAAWFPVGAAWFGSIVACWGLHHSNAEKEVLEWQRTVVYKIIDEKTKSTGKTISFGEIEIEYVQKLNKNG
jgi:hypothetical protein